MPVGNRLGRRKTPASPAVRHHKTGFTASAFTSQPAGRVLEWWSEQRSADRTLFSCHHVCRHPLSRNIFMTCGIKPARFLLEKKYYGRMLWVSDGGARLGASSGAPSLRKTTPHPGVLGRVAWIDPAGRHATGGHEPRQVRKEAAISGSGCVVDWFGTVMVRGTRPKTPGWASRCTSPRLPPASLYSPDNK